MINRLSIDFLIKLIDEKKMKTILSVAPRHSKENLSLRFVTGRVLHIKNV